MRYILLVAIDLYWRWIPAGKRRKCIYRNSCSHYVYEQAKAFGIISGVKALLYRARRCNPNFELFKNPVTGDTEIILSTGEVLGNKEMSERLSGL